MKKIVIVLLGMCLLYGCGNGKTVDNDSDNIVYEGLDAKESYQKAVEYFNNQVNYYEVKVEDSGMTIYNEYYDLKDRFAMVSKELYEDDNYSSINYTIIDGHNYYSVFPNEDETYSYSYADDYLATRETMYESVYDNSDIEVIDIERVDSKDSMVLRLKLKSSIMQQENDEDIDYMLDEITIDNRGYIVAEKKTYYEEGFQKIIRIGENMTYSQFNQKDKNTLNKEIEIMKDCEGLNYEEIIKKIGLS